MARFWLFIVVLTGGFCAVGTADGAPNARYIAVFTNGTRIEGETISGWHDNSATPQLDGTSLADPGRPLRWLRDTTLSAWQPTATAGSYVELFGGDRLPGKVVGIVPGKSSDWTSTPAILIVHPAVTLGASPQSGQRPIRVLAEEVRRVVFETTVPRRLKPGTLFYRNGRTVAYRSLRWGEDAVTLLTLEGVCRVPLEEIAEVHLPQRDPWRRYYRRVAMLSPDGTARLIRLETGDGLITTGSTDCFRAIAQHGTSNPSHWYHMIQPVWSLDPLWVRFTSIRTRWNFAPHEVPLSQFQPVESVQRSRLGNSWVWQADRNVQGGDLQSGGWPYGWGFGVHANCELFFEIPDCAQSFQSRIGMDQIAGKGGCARAMVYLDDTKGPPLFQSKHLIGSDNVEDTRVLKITGRGGKPRRLVLVADSAQKDRPAGADPFDVRDHVDWLEPLVLLDRRKLQAEIRKHAPELIPAWHGWTVSVPGGGPVPVQLQWDESDRYVPVVAAGNRTITFSTERQIGESDRWLRIHLRQIDEWTDPGNVEVRVDGKPVARMKVVRSGHDRPWLVPLQPFQGRQVKLEVVFTPGNEQELIDWRTLAITKGKTQTKWEPLEVVGARSLGGATLTEQPDGSFLAGGKNPPLDTYELHVKTGLPQITAFRLEVLPDESLPGYGPGRSFYGNFVLSQFRVMQPVRGPKPIRGRYVRVEIPGKGKILNLAEVQVFAGDKNLATAGKASQSTTEEDCAAAKAIDGNTGGDYDKQEVSRTQDNQDHTWWEVDLGKTHNIDRIVVWNRTDKIFGQRTTGFRVAVLDKKRKVAWKQEGILDPPAPATEFSGSIVEPVPIKGAITDFSRGKDPRLALDSTLGGWETAPDTGKPHVAIFTPATPLDATESGLVILMRQALSHHNLGRFRLTATADPPPIPAEPVAIELPPWTDGGPVSQPPDQELPPMPELIAKGMAATVLVEVEGRRASGVLVGNEGYVLTAGHVMVGKGKDATITLTDGRKLKAKTAGIDRDYDLGLVKIEDKAERTGLEIADAATIDIYNRYAGFSIYFDISDPPTAIFYIGTVWEMGEKTYRADCQGMGVLHGGPMLDIEGRIGGLHTVYSSRGLLQFSKTQSARENWARLARGDVWGRWLPGSGPMIGVITSGNRIIYIFPDSPAEKAGIQLNDRLEKINGTKVASYTESEQVLADKSVGDEVTVDICRGKEKPFQKKIRLMPRTQRKE